MTLSRLLTTLVLILITVWCSTTVIAQTDTVDVGEIACGEYKDTTLTLFNNTPNSQVLVSMELSDVAAGDYSVVSFPIGQFLPPNSSFSIVLRCKPSFPTQRRVVVRGVLDNQTTTAYTTSKTVFSVAKSARVIVDEISLVTQDSKPVDGALILKNPTKEPIQVNSVETVNPPITVVNTTFPIIIPANGQDTVFIRYTPTSFNEFFTLVQFNFNKCSIKNSVRVFCKNSRKPPQIKSMTLEFATATVKVGEIADVVVTRSIPNTLLDTTIAAEIEIEIRPPFITPIGSFTTLSTSSTVSRYRIPLVLPANTNTPTVLQFQTALGTDSIAQISVVSGNIVNVDSSTVTSSGTTVSVTDFCEAGGKRLVNTTNSLVLLAPYPNPSNGFVVIHAQTLLRGVTTLSLINSFGERVFQEQLLSTEPGDVDMNISTSFLPSGRYTLVLSNAGLVCQQPITIIK